MARKKVAYYYDTETCTYHRVKVDHRMVLRKVLTFGLLGALAVFLSFNAFGMFFTDDKAKGLLAERDTLHSTLGAMHDLLDEHEEVLEDLLSKDNSLYLPIVGSKQLSTEEWCRDSATIAQLKLNPDDPTTEVMLRIQQIRHQVNTLKGSYQLVEKRMMAKEKELENVPSILPVNGRLNSGFGHRRHPVTGAMKMHTGLDFDCSEGTPLYATGDGVVSHAGYGENGYGMYVDINHQNGYVTKYAHMSKTKVKAGQKVTRGQMIGYSGNTGLSTGPHLHYEIIHKGEKIDPVDFFYMDLSPEEYRRLRLDPKNVTKEAVKQKLDVPAMD